MKSLINELGDVIDGKPLHEEDEGLGAQGSVLDDASRALDAENESDGTEEPASGERAIEEGYNDSEIAKLKKDEIWAVQIRDDVGTKTKWMNIDEECMKALNKAWKSKK